jgi:HD-like signal output (HDOD) protein
MPIESAETLDAQARVRAEQAGSAFVRELAEALAKGPVELPGYPDVALRVQDMLADESVNSDAVVRIVGTEPMLAARVVSIANSAALNPAGAPVADLRTAVARLGFDVLRAAAVSFAVSQLARRKEFLHVEPQMNLLWLDSVAMASTCSVVARHCGRVSTDKALFAGLVAGVGRIWILARASQHPDLLRDSGAYQAIQEQWQAGIARVLLESWHVADEVVEAVQAYGRLDHEAQGIGTLPDVLATAAFLNRHAHSPELMAAQLPEARAAGRLGLAPADCEYLLQRAGEEMAALRTALGR